MAFCASCGTQMADNAAFCPGCGRPTNQGSNTMGSTAPPPPEPITPVPPASQPVSAAAPLADNIAGMLAYITFIPAVIFLLIEPYNRNRFVRFHSFQSLFFHVGIVILDIALIIASSILHIVPVIGTLVSIVLWPLISLGIFLLWILLLVKAYQGQMFKLPIIGDMAERQAGM
jgi:uncharacterized membrane protein